MSVFKDQSLLTIRLDTHQDLTGATELKILYVKPDGTKGSWTATADGQVVQYVVNVGDIDQSSYWTFQSYLKVGTKEATGDKVKQYFGKNIKP